MSISQKSKTDNPATKRSTLPFFGTVDTIVILLIGIGSGFALPILKDATPSHVTIFRENRIVATWPLSGDRTITIEGSQGPVTVVIRNKAVSITHATCPHGICVKTGPISRPHAQIVCAPNRILVTVTSSSADSVDAVVR
jgi:hypothetical protein